MTDKTLRNNTKPILVPVIFCLIIILFEIFNLSRFFNYEHDLFYSEYWRMITAHYSHLDWKHAVLNILGFLIVWILLLKDTKPVSFILINLYLSILISTGLFIFNPEITWYAGSSGLLHGFFVIGALRKYYQGNKNSLLLLLFLIIKLAWETFYGPLSISDFSRNGRVITDAHLYGAISGLIYIASQRVYTQLCRRQIN